MKPILFNTEMVRAILDGRKMVTRRLVKPKYSNTHFNIVDTKYGKEFREIQNQDETTHGKNKDGTSWQKLLWCREVLPQYKVGEILYVREMQSIYRINNMGNKFVRVHFKVDDSVIDFKVSEAEWKRLTKYDYTDEKFISPYWTTKETCRIFLKVTDVRVERLQDITEEQIVKEGLSPCDDICQDINWKPTYNDPDSGGDPNLKQGFEILWNTTIKEEWQEWKSNPYVWVIEFERCEKPEEPHEN